MKMKFETFLDYYKHDDLELTPSGAFITKKWVDRCTWEWMGGKPLGEIEAPTREQFIEIARRYTCYGNRDVALIAYVRKHAKAIADQCPTANDILKLVSDVELVQRGHINIAEEVILADFSRIQALMGPDQLLDLFRISSCIALRHFREAFDSLQVPLECYADFMKLAKTFGRYHLTFKYDESLRKRLIPAGKAVSFMENAGQFIQLSQCYPFVATYLLSEQGRNIAALFNTAEEILGCFSVKPGAVSPLLPPPDVGNKLLPFIDWKKIASSVTSYNQFQEIKLANSGIAWELLRVDRIRLMALTPLPNLITTEDSIQEAASGSSIVANQGEVETEDKDQSDIPVVILEGEGPGVLAQQLSKDDTPVQGEVETEDQDQSDIPVFTLESEGPEVLIQQLSKDDTPVQLVEKASPAPEPKIRTSAQQNFVEALDNIRGLSIQLLLRGHSEAASKANDLHRELKSVWEKYQDNTMDKSTFAVKFNASISKALPVLASHRGWKNVYYNLGLALLGLGLIYLVAALYHHHKSGNFFFKSKTNSEKTVNALQHTARLIDTPDAVLPEMNSALANFQQKVLV